MKQTARGTLNQLQVAPRKVRLLVDLIRGMHVADALAQLQFSKKHSAKPVLKLLRSVVANAEHNASLDINTLVVKEAVVGGGPILYRWMPRAFGRAAKIRKRTSHITIVVEGDVKRTPQKSRKKKETLEEKKDVDVQEERGAKDAKSADETNMTAPKKKKK